MKFYQKGNFKTSRHQMGKKPRTIRTKEKEEKKGLLTLDGNFPSDAPLQH